MSDEAAGGWVVGTYFCGHNRQRHTVSLKGKTSLTSFIIKAISQGNHRYWSPVSVTLTEREHRSFTPRSLQNRFLYLKSDLT